MTGTHSPYEVDEFSPEAAAAREAWAERGRAIRVDEHMTVSQQRQVVFRRADWFLEGEREWPETHVQYIDEEEYRPGYIANLKTVARRFPPLLRRFDLAFGHYQAVAPLPNVDALALLELAEQDRWSRQRLIDAKKAISRPCPECQVKKRRSLMVQRGELFVCVNAECGHEEPYSDPVEVVSVRQPLELVREATDASPWAEFRIHRDLLPGFTAATESTISYKYTVPALTLVKGKAVAARAA